MILAENVFGDEGFFMMVNVVLIMMHFMSSSNFGVPVQYCVIAHEKKFK
jgi:hypothetical protein